MPVGLCFYVRSLIFFYFFLPHVLRPEKLLRDLFSSFDTLVCNSTFSRALTLDLAEQLV